MTIKSDKTVNIKSQCFGGLFQILHMVHYNLVAMTFRSNRLPETSITGYWEEGSVK